MVHDKNKPFKASREMKAHSRASLYTCKGCMYIPEYVCVNFREVSTAAIPIYFRDGRNPGSVRIGLCVFAFSKARWWFGKCKTTTAHGEKLWRTHFRIWSCKKGKRRNYLLLPHDATRISPCACLWKSFTNKFQNYRRFCYSFRDTTQST